MMQAGMINRQCHIDTQQESAPPCTIVIFGASGDLTSRKLIPSLHTLYKNGHLPSPFSIVGCSRTDLTNESFRKKLFDFYVSAFSEKPKNWDDFAQHIFYQPVVYDDRNSFEELGSFLKELDRKRKTRGNKIFYLAVPPKLYPIIPTTMGKAGLAVQETETNGWIRLVVEKPFGHDLDSAIELDKILHTYFTEQQIFRIDHYLAKETIQNILMLRFANSIFEPIWNRSYIDYIGVIAAEKLGVEHRAGYYDQTGVIRDMFQNHIMQLMALTAMEPPSVFAAHRVQDEKVKVFRSLKPFDTDLWEENLILGQYGKGEIDGEKVRAYREEEQINQNSITPTFALMRVFVDNWRWKGVPFYLASGKRLQEKSTKIVVQFKNVPHSMFKNVLSENIDANRLEFGVFPHEEISLTFQAKSPGSQVCLRPVQMNFNYDHFETASLDAYEKVLLDCIHGDHMLFWRQDGVELTWDYLTPILEKCEPCLEKEGKLHFYPAGSRGPEKAQKWMKLIG